MPVIFVDHAYFSKTKGPDEGPKLPLKNKLQINSTTSNYLVNVVCWNAPRVGFEPTTFSLHAIHYFHNGVDYIIILRCAQDVSVSSLYGFLGESKVPTVLPLLAWAFALSLSKGSPLSRDYAFCDYSQKLPYSTASRATAAPPGNTKLV